MNTEKIMIIVTLLTIVIMLAAYRMGEYLHLSGSRVSKPNITIEDPLPKEEPSSPSSGQANFQPTLELKEESTSSGFQLPLDYP